VSTLRIVGLAALVALAPARAFSQSAPPPAATSGREQIDQARHMRTAGVALTAVGVVGTLMLVAGLIAYAVPQPCYPPAVCDPTPVIRIAAPIGGTLAGLGLGVGIPLWVVGQRRLDRLEHAGRLSLAPTAGGASLNYVLRF
jgi:hypothetical protein